MKISSYSAIRNLNEKVLDSVRLGGLACPELQTFRCEVAP